MDMNRRFYREITTFFRKVHFQYSLFRLEYPLFLRSKVHLYEVFDYEARFSRSKVDF